MIPQRIAVRGFLSYRDEQILDLDDADLWVFAGRNGSGKSAIFDAITFALFGMHRGGQQNASALIHHGSDGFRIDFDFALGDRLYRIRRSLRRSGRAERQAFVQVDGEDWAPIPGTSSDAGLRQWVHEQLGLSYATFTSSVLLLQGQADRLLSATPKDRHKVLAGIVDLERFERLALRADQLRQRRKAEADALAHQLRGTPAVRPEDVDAAADRAERAAQARAEATTEWRLRFDRLAQAGRWQAATLERDRLARSLQESLALLDRSELLVREAGRARELGAVVPILVGALEHRRTLAMLEASHDQGLLERNALARRCNLAASYLSDAETAREAIALALRCAGEESTELAKRSAALAGPLARARLAEEAREESARLRGEAERLADIAMGGWRAFEEAQAQAESARERFAHAKAKAAEAARQLERLEDLGPATACDHCGQRLTSQHLAEERGRRETSLADAREAFAASERARDEAIANEKDRGRQATASRREFDRIRARIDTLDPIIGAHIGGPGLAALAAEADGLRDESERLEAECTRIRAQHDLAQPIARALRGLHRDYERELADRERSIQQGAIRLAGLIGQLDQARAGLPDPWRMHLDALSPTEVHALVDELADLRARQVEVRANELPRARERAEEARDRLNILGAELESIPVEARRDPTEFAPRVAEAERIAAEAERAEREAAVRAEALRQSLATYQGLQESALAAARDHRVAETLAKLLGRDGLQRVLLRQAEVGILACANPILREISGDELQLRAAVAEEGDAEPVFALEAVECIDGATQVQAVEFLSGSQRFRVAVALALGIGRYARGLHRPIESVIIDEGFGSLDRHGRHEMIQQLQALRGTLARILLVSHQDEFIEAFQDGYRFERVDGRTIVEPFHR